MLGIKRWYVTLWVTCSYMHLLRLLSPSRSMDAMVYQCMLVVLRNILYWSTELCQSNYVHCWFHATLEGTESFC